MNRTVFISGCNRGIGRETAILFAQNGWNIVAHSRKKSEQFEVFLDELSSKNKIGVIPIYFDMTDESEMKNQIKEVLPKNRIEINALINNAGVIDVNLFMLTTVADIRRVFEVNLFSHMRLTQLVLKRIPKGGSIVNVSSMDAYEPQRGESAYSSSKAAMLAWTEVLKKELLGSVRVNAVAPHSVNTDLARSVACKAEWKENDLIDPKLVAQAIFFLASDNASAITGEVLRINGNHR